jgi:TonB family protein
MKILMLLAGALVGSVLLTAQEQRPTGVFFIENSLRLANTVQPECTPEAVQSQVREIVTVNVQINTQGEPARLEVVESPGFGLGPKALEAISQWRWQVPPGRFGNEDERVDATVQMSFQCKVLPPMTPN